MIMIGITVSYRNTQYTRSWNILNSMSFICQTLIADTSKVVTGNKSLLSPLLVTNDLENDISGLKKGINKKLGHGKTFLVELA